MNEGWGTDWLPPSIQRRAALDDAREAREARAAEAERERAIEARREQALSDYAAGANLRGEALDVMALAAGRVPHRTVSDVLTAAAAAAEADDRRDEMHAWRNGHGEPEKIHVEFVGDPNIITPAARSGTGWKIAQRARHFNDLLQARAQLKAAERAAEQSRLDYGFVCERRNREDDDPVVVASASRRRSAPAADDGLRFRGGGFVVGIQ